MQHCIYNADRLGQGFLQRYSITRPINRTKVFRLELAGQTIAKASHKDGNKCHMCSKSNATALSNITTSSRSCCAKSSIYLYRVPTTCETLSLHLRPRQIGYHISLLETLALLYDIFSNYVHCDT